MEKSSLMKVLLIDNNDSFTYNIVNTLEKIKDVVITVSRSNEFNIDELAYFEKVIISPGPGKPAHFPILKEVISYCLRYHKPLLGICLGHQAICEYFGATLIQLDEVIHGQQKLITIDNSFSIYRNLAKQIEVGLYHSWTINPKTLPDCLEVTGMTSEQSLMSVVHKNTTIYGVQFHPESFMTTYGDLIFKNFLKA